MTGRNRSIVPIVLLVLCQEPRAAEGPGEMPAAWLVVRSYSSFEARVRGMGKLFKRQDLDSATLGLVRGSLGNLAGVDLDQPFGIAFCSQGTLKDIDWALSVPIASRQAILDNLKGLPGEFREEGGIFTLESTLYGYFKIDDPRRSLVFSKSREVLGAFDLSLPAVDFIDGGGWDFVYRLGSKGIDGLMKDFERYLKEDLQGATGPPREALDSLVKEGLVQACRELEGLEVRGSLSSQVWRLEVAFAAKPGSPTGLFLEKQGLRQRSPALLYSPDSAFHFAMKFAMTEEVQRLAEEFNGMTQQDQISCEYEEIGLQFNFGEGETGLSIWISFEGSSRWTDEGFDPVPIVGEEVRLYEDPEFHRGTAIRKLDLLKLPSFFGKPAHLFLTQEGDYTIMHFGENTNPLKAALDRLRDCPRPPSGDDPAARMGMSLIGLSKLASLMGKPDLVDAEFLEAASGLKDETLSIEWTFSKDVLVFRLSIDGALMKILAERSIDE